MGEIVAVGRTVTKCGASIGDTGVLQGVGPVSLSAVAAARETDAALIIATGVSRDRARLELNGRVVDADERTRLQRVPAARPA